MKNKFSRRSFLYSTWSSLLLASSCSFLPNFVKAGHNSEDLESVKKLLAGANPLKWIFTGDSITQGAKHTLGYRSYPEIFAERVRWEIRRPRDFVINTAVSGHTTKHILDDFDWRVSQFHPHVVSLMIGTNDAANGKISPGQFEENLGSLLLKTKSAGAILILHTPNPILADKAPERKSLPVYAERIREFAGLNKLILVDHFKYWTETKNKKPMEEWLKDPLHPNPQGHLEMARLLFRELSIFDAKAFTCSGKI